MARTATGSGGDGGAWAGTVADAALDREATGRLAEADAADRAAHLRGAVSREGAAWFVCAEGACRAAAEAFNGKVGRPVLTVERSRAGLIVVTARIVEGAGFVQVVPFCSVEDGAPAPGALVTERRHGRESTRPYDFALDGVTLVLCASGETFSPEAFARAILAPWLASIPLPKGSSHDEHL